MNLKKREPEFDPDLVRQTSIAVYKMRLIAGSGEGAVERMLEKDGDNGEKLAERSKCFDIQTRCYLRILGPRLDD